MVRTGSRHAVSGRPGTRYTSCPPPGVGREFALPSTWAFEPAFKADWLSPLNVALSAGSSRRLLARPGLRLADDATPLLAHRGPQKGLRANE